jgi:hypothetical protein
MKETEMFFNGIFLHTSFQDQISIMQAGENIVQFKFDTCPLRNFFGSHGVSYAKDE